MDVFELYERYQMVIHGDDPDSITVGGFRRFLCDTPLEVTL